MERQIKPAQTEKLRYENVSTSHSYAPGEAAQTGKQEVQDETPEPFEEIRAQVRDERGILQVESGM